MAVSSTRPSRKGRKTLIAYVDPELAREIKLLSVERSTSVQAIMEEALENWLEGQPRQAEYKNGRLRTAAGQIITDAELAGLKRRDLSRYIEIVEENAGILPSAMVRAVRDIQLLLEQDNLEARAPERRGRGEIALTGNLNARPAQATQPATVTQTPGKYDYARFDPQTVGASPEARRLPNFNLQSGSPESPIRKPVRKGGLVMPQTPETQDSHGDQE